MIQSIFDTAATTTSTAASLPSLLLCTLISILLGLATAILYMKQGSYTKSFVITLAAMPAMVQLVITLVNGNLGTGIAVMGAFSLIRFRSAAGTAREISHIFLAMALGLADGMGYLAVAILFFVLIGGLIFVLDKLKFGEVKDSIQHLKILIPEHLDYTEIFDDLFDAYTAKRQLTQIRTTNMGSLYELRYDIILKNEKSQKEFVDKLRIRNGNLNITCGRPLPTGAEL